MLVEVKCQSNIKLVPCKIYPYCSLKDSLTLLVSRPGFLDLCEHWRERSLKVPVNTLADVYEGQVWHDFNSQKYDNFLQCPGNLLLSLNFDFFHELSTALVLFI